VISSHQLIAPDNELSEDGLQKKFNIEEVLAGALNLLLAECQRDRPESRKRTPSPIPDLPARFQMMVRSKKKKPRITRKAKNRARNERRLARIKGEVLSAVSQINETKVLDLEQSSADVADQVARSQVGAQLMIVARRDRFKKPISQQRTPQMRKFMR
jgi:hypothetical protein